MTRQGADELVFLGHNSLPRSEKYCGDMVRRVAETIFIPFTVGGGIRTVDDFRRYSERVRTRYP